MKKIVLIGLLFVGFNCFAQEPASYATEAPGNNLPSTNQKEYNYLTKGLKIQRESGLDIIDGYRLVDGGQLIVGQYGFNFSILVSAAAQDLKAISVVVNSGVTKSTYYVCIPVNNAVLLNDYVAVISQFSPALTNAFNVALAKKYSELYQVVSEKNKK